MKNKDLPLILAWIYPATKFVVLGFSLLMLALIYMFAWGNFRDYLDKPLQAIADLMPPRVAKYRR